MRSTIICFVIIELLSLCNAYEMCHGKYLVTDAASAEKFREKCTWLDDGNCKFFTCEESGYVGDRFFTHMLPNNWNQKSQKIIDGPDNCCIGAEDLFGYCHGVCKGKFQKNYYENLIINYKK